MVVAEDVFTLLSQLDRQDKWRVMQFLVAELANQDQTPQEPKPTDLGWPPNYFEETYGALKDDPIERPPQNLGALPT